MTPKTPTVGVAIVAYNSADVIRACLDSLRASVGVHLRIVVTDNRSTDDSVAVITAWALEQGPGFTFAAVDVGCGGLPDADLTIIRSPINGGYGHGINVALRALLADPAIDLFWILNPDCVVPPDAALAYYRAGGDDAFALMSGRTVYLGTDDRIQTDGGRVHRWTGVCQSINQGKPVSATAMPSAESIDYVTGANMVASRRFIEQTGLMPEEYFLYYEEVDWAFQRGSLPLRLVDGVTAYHHGGTTIGTGASDRLPSPFAFYFNQRNRLRFTRRHRAIALPIVFAYGLAKAAVLLGQGARSEAAAVLAATLGRAPSAAIRNRVSAGPSRVLAFGKSGK